MSRRKISRGGNRNVFLGTSECAAYVEPCVFGEGKGAYDEISELDFGFMYHGITYPDEAFLPEEKDKMTINFWRPVMRSGVIEFLRPEECPVKRPVRAMKMKPFGVGVNFSVDEEDE